MFAAEILPPCRSMTERQIDRPIPQSFRLAGGEGIEDRFELVRRDSSAAVLNFDQRVRFINRVVRTTRRRGPSSPVPLMALKALIIRVRMTC